MRTSGLISDQVDGSAHWKREASHNDNVVFPRKHIRDGKTESELIKISQSSMIFFIM